MTSNSPLLLCEQRVCATCGFFMAQLQKIKGPDGTLVQPGLCRRYPPKNIVVHGLQERADMKNGVLVKTSVPVTNVQPLYAQTIDSQWCGEYRPAELLTPRVGAVSELPAPGAPGTRVPSGAGPNGSP